MPSPAFPHRHLLGIAQLSAADISLILDEAEGWLEFNRGPRRRLDRMAGLCQVNAFFENSTRTLLSFEMAGKKLGAEVVNMHVAQSSVQKGESLVDTAQTINAMRPDIFVMRHGEDGAAAQVAAVMDCPVVNAGDGRGEHPSQALLDALTIRRRFGRVEGLTIAICGDILHSRVARSNMLSLTRLGASVRVVGPPSLLPSDLPSEIASFTDFDAGIARADVIMMLRIQRERMQSALSETLGAGYHAAYGLDRARLNACAPDAVVMHPGPMNRGIEISGDVADDPERSLVLQQVEAGVAVRMAILDLLTRR